MDNYKDLEEANKEIERSKAILHDTENLDINKGNEAKEGNEDEDKSDEKKEGSGIFTADGKELPKIDGGYDIINPGGNVSDNEFVSV